MATNNQNDQNRCVSETVTVAETVSLHHKWTIEKFSDLETFCLRSELFGSEESNDKWFMKLEFINWSANTGYMIISLNVNSRQTLRAKYSLSLLESNGVHRFKKSVSEMVEFVARSSVDSSSFESLENNDHHLTVRKNAFYNFRASLLGNNDSLQILCSIVVIGTPSSILKRYIGPKIYNDTELEENSFQKDLIVFIESIPPEVVIETSDGSLFAHKVLLASRSSVFRAMLAGQSGEIRCRIESREFNRQVMKAVLQFVYTDTVTNVVTFVNQLLIAANKYQLIKLQKICEEILLRTVTTTTVGSVLSIADSCGATKLKDRVLDYIASNAGRIISSNEWYSQVEKPEIYKETMHAIYKRRRVI